MNCDQLAPTIDDFVDGRLDGAEREATITHIDGCESCATQVRLTRRLRAGLREYGRRDVPERDQQYFAQALAKAAAAGSKRVRYRYWVRGFGSAIATGVAIFAVTLMFLQAPQTDRQSGTIATVTMTLEEVRTVNLVFASAQDLDDASLTVTLPPGIELYGFEGQSEVTWMTSLARGRNVLPLRLVATTPAGGELLATLRHEGDDRSFRLRVETT